MTRLVFGLYLRARRWNDERPRKRNGMTQLPKQDEVELVSRFEHYHAPMWDREAEDDLEAGCLDALLAEVDKEYEAGLAQPL